MTYRIGKILCFLLICLSEGGVNSACYGQSISRKQALLIVEGTEEVRGMYELNNGRFVNCIEKSVVRPCDSEWVTCIEDAWVVEFNMGGSCGIVHDGRLKITMVVNGNTGEIISRFPEKDYFFKKNYCMENYDCMRNNEEQKGSKSGCLNFIYGQINLGKKLTAEGCECKENVCQVKVDDK